MKLLLLIFLELVLMINLKLCGQDKSHLNECEIKLSIKDTTYVFKKNDWKCITLIISNQSKKPIKIPQWFKVGTKNDFEPELIFEIEKKDSNNKYSIFKDDLDDYDYIAIKRKLITILPNDKVIMKQAIEIVNTLNFIGNYRIRAILKLNFKNLNCQEIFSNWLEFTVI